MDSNSPLLADAFDLLRFDLYAHLDEAEYLATSYHKWSTEEIDTARTLIPDLVTVIRGLLIAHPVQPSGTCPACTHPSPCTVVTTIHKLIKDPTHHFVALVTKAHDAP